MAESTPNLNTEESVMDYSHEYEVLMKDVRNVTFELNVAEFIDVKIGIRMARCTAGVNARRYTSAT